MSSIFHYTDANGLLGILSTNSIFATDYRYLNDLTEGAVIRDLILPIFEIEAAEIIPKLEQQKWIRADFYKEYGERGHLLLANRMYNSITRVVDDLSPLFVVSFCRHEQDSQEFHHGLLSQWRGYGDNGGFAIEFDSDELDKLIASEDGQFSFIQLKSHKILYDNFEMNFDASVYQGVAGEMIFRVFEGEGIDIGSIVSRADAEKVEKAVFDFITSAPFFKHWGFREENEYRIAAGCLRLGKDPEGFTKKSYKEVRFRSRGGLIVPYVPLFDSVEAKLPIRAVIVGPHPLQERQAEALRLALEYNRVKVEVRLSEIPYRR